MIEYIEDRMAGEVDIMTYNRDGLTTEINDIIDMFFA